MTKRMQKTEPPEESNGERDKDLKVNDLRHGVNDELSRRERRSGEEQKSREGRDPAEEARSRKREATPFELLFSSRAITRAPPSVTVSWARWAHILAHY